MKVAKLLSTSSYPTVLLVIDMGSAAAQEGKNTLLHEQANEPPRVSMAN